eukprot:15366203-Ditylum_brightwellii.AAC.2
MSSGMNPLMVEEEELSGENIKLPWEDEAETDITQLCMLEPQIDNNDDLSQNTSGDTSVPTVLMN